MRISSFRLQNFRSFVDTSTISLSSINVLIGANNAGKSSILRGLHQLQHGLQEHYADVRVGAEAALLEIHLSDARSVQHWPTKDSDAPCTFEMRISSTDRRTGQTNMALLFQDVRRAHQTDLRLPSVEPHHFIVPYFSKRKAVSYQEDIREQHVHSITPDVSFLAAKLSRLANPAFPAHKKYAEACESILGFQVTAIPSPNGQRPGIYLPDGQRTLPIEQLGEGVPNVVHFLANLAVSEGKLFLIEELENDLHPQALKALLDLIIDSAQRNQFVISTHSNIVVRHLCSVTDSRLFRIAPRSGDIPIESEIKEIPNQSSARLAVLSELGYSLSDFELWDGWLILEESSAERIIRDYLVPWFAPNLSRIRTISSGGASKVAATFEELNRLFLFTHLTPTYRDSSWVIADGDEAGSNAIEKLREKFPSHRPNQFIALSESAFENYYPQEFSDKVKLVFSGSPETRREAKKNLLHEVMEWLDADEVRGKAALSKSADEVIKILQSISASLTPHQQ
ncbi:MAG: AAA family ATPase [Rhodocyclaceae bacterium]